MVGLVGGWAPVALSSVAMAMAPGYRG
jgi:hypothetical protein